MKNKTKKNLILTLATTGLVVPAVAIPTVLTSCTNSTNNQDNSNGTNQPSEVQPLAPVNTDHIKTFAEARTFAIDYMKKNYTKEMLISDMQKLAKEQSDKSTSQLQGQGVVSIKLTNFNFKSNKLNFDYEYTITMNGTNEKQSLLFKCRKYNIYPILVLLPEISHLQLSFITDKYMQPPFDNKKQESEFINQDKPYNNCIYIETNLNWTFSTIPPVQQREKINQTKYENPTIQTPIISNSLNLKFKFVNDIQENLYKGN